MGRFLPVDVGLQLIVLVGGLAFADQSRDACFPVRASRQHHLEPVLHQ